MTVLSISQIISEVEGEKIKGIHAKDPELIGTVVKFEPLGSGMCDLLVRFEGIEYWDSSRLYLFKDGSKLPDRRELIARAKSEANKSLRRIRGEGNSIVEEMIDRAIEETS